MKRASLLFVCVLALSGCHLRPIEKCRNFVDEKLVLTKYPSLKEGISLKYHPSRNEVFYCANNKFQVFQLLVEPKLGNENVNFVLARESPNSNLYFGVETSRLYVTDEFLAGGYYKYGGVFTGNEGFGQTKTVRIFIDLGDKEPRP